jgi:uncharacterized OB-fold protein
MTEISCAPDVGALEVPIDVWTQPFWEAAGQGSLRLVRCADCRRFRWPPGPFCPHCQSQAVDWAPTGPARIYSFTVIRASREGGGEEIHVPALVEFPDCDGVRLLAAIVDAPLSAVRTGAAVIPAWSRAANVQMPVFRLAG